MTSRVRPTALYGDGDDDDDDDDDDDGVFTDENDDDERAREDAVGERPGDAREPWDGDQGTGKR